MIFGFVSLSAILSLHRLIEDCCFPIEQPPRVGTLTAVTLSSCFLIYLMNNIRSKAIIELVFLKEPNPNKIEVILDSTIPLSSYKRLF